MNDVCFVPSLYSFALKESLQFPLTPRTLVEVLTSVFCLVETNLLTNLLCYSLITVNKLFQHCFSTSLDSCLWLRIAKNEKQLAGYHHLKRLLVLGYICLCILKWHAIKGIYFWNVLSPNIWKSVPFVVFLFLLSFVFVHTEVIILQNNFED